MSEQSIYERQRGLQMPLVRIELSDEYQYSRARQIADAVHSAIVLILRVPAKDRFQIINRLPAGSIIAEDAGLGFERSNGVVVVQIFTQRGRTAEVKGELFAQIAGNLKKIGVAGQDLFIGYHENGPDDWSFGFGRAQYVTGELAIPSATAI